MIRRMKTALAAVLLTALLPSAMASAQTMDFACPDPGTTFTYDSGTKVVARGRDGMDCNMEIVGGKPYKLRALLFDNPCARRQQHLGLHRRAPARAAVAAAGRQEDRGGFQRRRPELALHPDGRALRETQPVPATP